MSVTYRTSAAGGGTSGTGDRTATITPAVGDLLIILCNASGNTNATPTCSDNNNSGTYTRIATALKNSSGDTLSAFVRDKFIFNTTSTTVTVATGSNTAGEITIIAVSKMSKVGAAAIRQSATQANQAASGTPAPAFASAVLTTNLTIGAVANGDNPATLTTPSGWTERQDVGQATPSTGLEVVTRDSGFTGTTVTWGSTSATAFASIIIELDCTLGAIMQLRAGDITGKSDGDALVFGDWPDQAGMGCALTATGGSPTYKSAVSPVSGPAVRFNGTSDYFVHNCGLVEGFFIAVGTSTATGVTDRGWMSVGTSSTQAPFYFKPAGGSVDGGVQVIVGNGGSAAVDLGAGHAANVPFIHYATVEGGTAELWINGQMYTSGSYAGQSTGNGTGYVGCTWYSGATVDFLQGDIYYLEWWPSKPDAATIAARTAMLRAAYLPPAPNMTGVVAIAVDFHPTDEVLRCWTSTDGANFTQFAISYIPPRVSGVNATVRDPDIQKPTIAGGDYIGQFTSISFGTGTTTQVARTTDLVMWYCLGSIVWTPAVSGADQAWAPSGVEDGTDFYAECNVRDGTNHKPCYAKITSLNPLAYNTPAQHSGSFPTDTIDISTYYDTTLTKFVKWFKNEGSGKFLGYATCSTFTGTHAIVVNGSADTLGFGTAEGPSFGATISGNKRLYFDQLSGGGTVVVGLSWSKSVNAPAGTWDAPTLCAGTPVGGGSTILRHGTVLTFASYTHTMSGGVTLSGSASSPPFAASATGSGGVTLGGSASTPSFATTFSMSGGLLAGGSSGASLAATYAPTGGAILGGAAVQSFAATFSMSGGLVTGGAATESWSATWLMTGTAILGGAAGVVSNSNFTATMSGGGVLGGSVAGSLAATAAMAGGMIAGGSVEGTLALSRTMAGGAVLGGAATVSNGATFTAEMSGGVNTGGSAVVAWATVHEMSGGIVAGGSATYTPPVILLPVTRWWYAIGGEFTWTVTAASATWLVNAAEQTWVVQGGDKMPLVENQLEKSPGDVRRFAMDFSAMPELADTGTIASITSITATPTGLTIASQEIEDDDKTASCVISGGTAGVTYSVTFLVVTSGGQTLQRTGTLSVKTK